MFGLDESAFILLVFFLVLYGLPSLIATACHHHQRMAIAALNLLLGWTVLGWIAALVWALTATPGQATTTPPRDAGPHPRVAQDGQSLPRYPAAAPGSLRALRLAPDNPARAIKKLPWKVSRLPQALTHNQVHQVLQEARTLGAAPGASAVQRALYRLVVAGIFFGLRRGEMQHLMWGDTNGRQVWIQGKTLPDGRSWLPKDREAQVIAYPGIERPISIVFGESPKPGFVFSPVANRARRFDADVLTKGVRRLLAPIDARLTLHSLRHTFATWRLMMGDPLLLVKGWMGHASAETLLRYAHVQPNVRADLLPLL